jgi:dihydroflavonol-4-reductase
MKILVTGANGFLGSWVTRALLSEGHDVRILARPSSDLSEIEGLRFTKAFGDVTDLSSVEAAMKDIESVFHLAGVIGYQRSQRPLMEKVNVGGTQNVLKACEKMKIKNLVYLSSVVAVGAGFKPDQILNENSAYNIGHLKLGYFDTKHEAEKLVIEAHEKGIVEAVIVNPSTIYGPGDAKKGSRKTQLKVAHGTFPFYTKGGVNVVDIEDVIYGIMTAWRKRLTGERFILAGENLLIKDLFALIADAAGVKPPTMAIPTPLLFALGYMGDFKQRLGLKGSLSVENAWSASLYHWFDNSKSKRYLGLQPNPAKFAISKSVAWIKEQRLLQS